MADPHHESFKHYALSGECGSCGSFQTMYVGEELIDEKCCRCGLIIGGGYASDQTRHEELREEYGTLNPHGRLMCSNALEREVKQIIDDSRAAGGRVVNCGPGHEVTVELTFEVDDFPELWPWEGWETEEADS